MTVTCEAGVLFACFNREGLADILPHRGAALRTIDSVFFDHSAPGSILGFKQVMPDEAELDGHFPSQPTYPGYAQDEFACLTAAALILYPLKGQGANPMSYRRPRGTRNRFRPGTF